MGADDQSIKHVPVYRAGFALYITLPCQAQMTADELLIWTCKAVYAADAKVAKDQKRAIFGDQFIPELLVMRNDKVRVEIRKETVPHNIPHMHISHSDKIDASISLINFSILAGTIKPKTLKDLSQILSPKQAELLAIWDELNEKENSVAAEMLISNLGL